VGKIDGFVLVNSQRKLLLSLLGKSQLAAVEQRYAQDPIAPRPAEGIASIDNRDSKTGKIFARVVGLKASFAGRREWMRARVCSKHQCAIFVPDIVEIPNL
jgi:hypothetical protein